MDGALNAAGLAAALLWRTLIGRELRRFVERVTGARSRVDHPLLDLLVGLLAGWLGFAVWSAVLKRVFGVGAPPAAFAVTELVVIVTLAAWRRAWAAPSASTPAPGVRTAVRVATFVALFAGLASGDIVRFRSDNVDHDQHVAWTMEIAHQGVVPDRYEGTDTAIAYPLGLHALAVSTASVLVSPHIVLNALPLVTTLLVVGLVCSACAAIALGRPSAGAASPPVDLVLLEAGATVAMSLALFSGHFSVWPHYLVNGRQVAGLCQLVPLLACLAALLPRQRLAGRPYRPALVSALLVGALTASGALAAALNPVLVPLQAVLCSIALGVAAIRRQVTWPGLPIGLAIGGALAISVVVSDPYLSRRANVPGLRPAAAPYLEAVQADVLRGYVGRSCLTPSCVAQALVSPVAFSVAREPLLAVTVGALELISAPPAPLRYDHPAPGRHRFPDLTGAGLAPVHGRVTPYVFALWPAAVAAVVLLARQRWLLGAVAAVALAIAVDASMRGAFRAIIDPGEPVLRLLPYYADIAAAILFTQVLWPLLFVGAAFAGARRDTARGRWLRLGIAGALFALLAVSAAGPVAAGMVSGRPLEDPSRADLQALARLERAAVPEGDSFLVSSELGHPVGERWVLPTDDAVLLYLHARRPTLFLFGLDHTARYGPAGFERTCEALAAGTPSPLTWHRARWAVAAGAPVDALATVGRRLFCGRRLREWFPAMRVAAGEGRLTLVELGDPVGDHPPPAGLGNQPRRE
jgi:hypothetical protein